MSSSTPSTPLAAEGGPSNTSRIGGTVRRAAGPWTPTVHALLRHLEDVGFTGSPRVVDSGFDPDGNEVLTFVEGAIQHPRAWTPDGIHQVGALLRRLHDTAPVIVLLVRWRNADRRQVVAIAAALAGLALLVGLPAEGPGAGAVLAGAVIAVLAGGGFAAMTLLATRPVPGLAAATTTGFAFVLGGALLVPLAVGTSGLAFTPDLRTLGLLVAFGTVPTALAYTCYFRGLRSASAGVGTVMALLEPLTAAVLAAVLLGDRLGLAGIAGAVLLGVAVVLAGRSGQDRDSERRARSS
ncbi:DMT family transporter [Pseudonocardia nigra]|uniref:DMT family transporter n=1 Tax=Pseudonocardia nigra TaxID=1921578 RepID=UPI001C5CFCF9|nr:DMT family transporter [Pseudonocardia nigra]